MTDPADLGEIVVIGQRRTSFDQGWPQRPTPMDDGLPTLVNDADGGGDPIDPCSVPFLRQNWNTDAAAARAIKEIKDVAQHSPATGGRGTSTREYGTVLWEMPDGSVIHGPIAWGEHTFQEAANSENGRAGVVLDWTSPGEGAAPIGTVHTHAPGDHRPSGLPGVNNAGDYGTLTSTQEWRAYYGANGQHARLYVGADNLVGANQTPTMQINIYSPQNIEAAVRGSYVGPQVNPDGQPCGS